VTEEVQKGSFSFHKNIENSRIGL